MSDENTAGRFQPAPTAAELNGTAEDAPAEPRCSTCFETRAGGAGACADPFHGAGEKAAGRPDIEGYKALCAKASAAPWYWEARGAGGHTFTLFAGANGVQGVDFQRERRSLGPLTITHDLNLLNTGSAAWDWNGEANRAFIAAARCAVPALIDNLERVEAQRDEAVRGLMLMQREKHAAEAERDALKTEVMRQAAECGESLAEIVKLRGALAEAKAAARDAAKARDGLRLELAQLRESSAREIARIEERLSGKGA